MKKNNKHGFTLVELLVVIAILAVLATVSIVGYTMFTRKANNSNALADLKQSVDIVLSTVISTSGTEADESITSGGITFEYNKGTGKIVFDDGVDEFPDGIRTNITAPMKRKFGDLNNVTGYYIYEKSGKIYYITENNKGIALWESGKDPTGSDIDVEDLIEKIDLDEDVDIDDLEDDENTVIVTFALCEGSENIGYLPSYIRVKKGTNVTFAKNYISYNDGNGKVVAKSGVIAKYYTSSTHDVLDNGIFGLDEVNEDITIYIEFSR